MQNLVVYAAYIVYSFAVLDMKGKELHTEMMHWWIIGLCFICTIIININNNLLFASCSESLCSWSSVVDVAKSDNALVGSS